MQREEEGHVPNSQDNLDIIHDLWCVLAEGVCIIE